MRSDRAHVAPEAPLRAAGAEGDPFDRFPPPFDLISDMLLAVGSCPVGPLRDTFPGVPFAAVAGRALLGTWFARVEEIRFDAGRRADRRGSEERPADVPYRELNVAVLLRGRRLFVPGIYATSELSLRLGHRYGMPKRRASMSYRADARGVESRAEARGSTSRLRARALSDGRGLATLLSLALPLWTWPVLFPSGRRLRARLEGVDRARIVWLRERRLALDEPWLPRPATLWPIALHLSGQRMRLPREGRP